MTLIGEGKITLPCLCGCGNLITKFKSDEYRKYFSKGCMAKYRRENSDIINRKKYESQVMIEEKDRIRKRHEEAMQHRATVFDVEFADYGAIL